MPRYSAKRMADSDDPYPLEEVWGFGMLGGVGYSEPLDADGGVGSEFVEGSGSTIRSLSVYEFDLDNFIIKIEDWDCFIPTVDLTLHKTDLPLKLKQIGRFHGPVIGEIRLGAEAMIHPWAMTDDEFMNEAMRSAVLPVKTGEIVSTQHNVQLKLNDDLVLDRSVPLIMKLSYEIEMQGYGNRFMYSGAIQPSDFEQARQFLDVKAVKKTICFHVWSSSMPLSAWVFNGSSQVHLPSELHSRPDREHHHVRQHITYHFPSWTRARYFSFFVETHSLD